MPFVAQTGFNYARKYEHQPSGNQIRDSAKFRVEDINDALELIFKYVEGMDYDAWQEDRKTMDAVIRNIEIIGEAAANIPEDIQNQYTEIPWHQMKGMRKNSFFYSKWLKHAKAQITLYI